jgi:hypothetical protein
MFLSLMVDKNANAAEAIPDNFDSQSLLYYYNCLTITITENCLHIFVRLHISFVVMPYPK